MNDAHARPEEAPQQIGLRLLGVRLLRRDRGGDERSQRVAHLFGDLVELGDLQAARPVR